MSEVGGVGPGNLLANLLPTAKEGAGGGFPGLRPGDVVQADLLRLDGKGSGVLVIGGREFQAVFPAGLSEGARLALRVVDVGPPLLLKLPGATEEPLARLLRPSSQGLAAAVRGVLEAGSGAAAGDRAAAPLLEAARTLLQLPQDPKNLAAALARLVGGSGLFHEHQLARGEDPGDLKGLLLKLLVVLNKGSEARAAESLLSHLEAHQARSAMEQQPVVPLVFPWGEEWVQGELRIERDGEDGRPGGRRGGVLRLRLEMPHLGPVEVRVRWGETGVSARLALRPDAAAVVRGHLEELTASLVGDAGVRLVDLRAEALERPRTSSIPSLVEVLA